MFEAKKIMKTDVITAKTDTLIYDAIRVMVAKNITGLPVVDDDMRLLGIVTEKDVLELLYENEEKPDTVGHYMTENVTTFDQNDSVVDIADSFLKNHFRRVPILADGKVVGVISRKDIIAYILKLRHEDK
jgi:CBS domain-containing protein